MPFGSKQTTSSLHKIVVLGAGGVGKTALGFMGVFLETYDPTIEDSYRKHFVVDQETCLLDVLDTAGQEEYTRLWDAYIRSSEGFILVYSIASRQSFARIQTMHERIRHLKTIETGPSAVDWPIFVVGNQSDRHTHREISSSEGIALGKQLGCQFFECSSKSADDVDHIFIEFVRECRLRRQASTSTPTAQPEETVQAVAPRSGGMLDRFLANIGRKSQPTGNQGRLTDPQALNTCLVNAARINDHRAVKRFLAKGADPNAQPGVDGAALRAAAAFGHVKIIKLLLKNGAAVNAKGLRDVTALQIAAAEGHAATVEVLLRHGAKVNEVSGLHGTALAAAASRARVDNVRILLASDADPNVAGGPYGNALQAAAYVGSDAVVELLVNQGARIETRGEGGCTALQVACFAGHLAVARLLLTRGSYVDAPGGRYGSALKAANDHGKTEVVKLLLARGASDAGVGVGVGVGVGAFPHHAADVATQELPQPTPEMPLRHQTAVELGAPLFHIPGPPTPLPVRAVNHRPSEMPT